MKKEMDIDYKRAFEMLVYKLKEDAEKLITTNVVDFTECVESIARYCIKMSENKKEPQLPSNDYTGLEMFHGTKSNVETIFNSTDSKKLYELIQNGGGNNIQDQIMKNLIEPLPKVDIIPARPTTINITINKKD